MTKNIYFSNRKEYYRRQKISSSLKRYYREREPSYYEPTKPRSLYFTDRKQYYKNKRILQEQFKKTKLRQQVVYNTGYSISLRAIVINGNLTLEDLEEALQTYISANEGLDNLDFDTTGLEEEEIDIKEDAGLQEGLIYVELNVKGNTTLTNL